MLTRRMLELGLVTITTAATPVIAGDCACSTLAVSNYNDELEIVAMLVSVSFRSVIK